MSLGEPSWSLIKAPKIIGSPKERREASWICTRSLTENVRLTASWQTKIKVKQSLCGVCAFSYFFLSPVSKSRFLLEHAFLYLIEDVQDETWKECYHETGTSTQWRLRCRSPSLFSFIASARGSCREINFCLHCRVAFILPTSAKIVFKLIGHSWHSGDIQLVKHVCQDGIEYLRYCILILSFPNVSALNSLQNCLNMFNIVWVWFLLWHKGILFICNKLMMILSAKTVANKIIHWKCQEGHSLVVKLKVLANFLSAKQW